MSSPPHLSPAHHRQSLLFGWRALFARRDAVLPPPQSPHSSNLEPWVVALLIFLPPVGLFVWWRGYRQRR
jgi:hypothetical protein